MTAKEPQCGVIREECNQLCNDPTDSIGNTVQSSLVPTDYHPSADTAKQQVTELDERVEELKKKLKDRENQLKKQEERVKKFQDAMNEVAQWLEKEEHQLNDYNLTEVDPTKIQEKMAAIKVPMYVIVHVDAKTLDHNQLTIRIRS